MLTKGLGSDFSFDSEYDTVANEQELLEQARESVNISSKGSAAKNNATSRSTSAVSRPASSASRTTSGKSDGKRKRGNKSTTSSVSVNSVSINFLNSYKFAKEDRPPFLQDDEVFNLLSVEAAAQQIMHWMQTKAMMNSNNIKEQKSKAVAGQEKPDEEIKPVKIEAGEDDALSKLHKQMFCLRTPLRDPKDYWDLYPRNWPEVNKSLYLDHLGLENICSPRTIELLHDRANKLEIKMFSTINISVGRSGGSRKQNLRTLEDGSTEVVSTDDWLSPTSVIQVIEALDNLGAIWVVIWPGEWSIVAIRRVVTKLHAFSDIRNRDLRKRMLEAFINEVLATNASHAARKKIPMIHEKIERLAKKYLDNKGAYERQLKTGDKGQNHSRMPINSVPPKGNPTDQLRREVKDLRKRVGNIKTPSGKDVCVFWNTQQGCRSVICKLEHCCAFIKEGGKGMCGGSHKKFEHYKKA